ncbi:MAG: ABC transporter permease [Rhodobacteraceae bacterium]|nr:ABC transporter permease [Alphaproteobacteria bacterium]MBT8475892.1 ABC transporter permease [Alphaproteobacteria bacterium]NNF72395.1 ABC transporter permease [Paracoccaceae bacterium]NNK67329.1 ABC transporter permease [Paracoccaceae bacterium]
MHSRPTALPRPSVLRALPAMMLREMATTYGRSPGGYLWAVVEPVAAIALLSFVFSMAFDAPSLGNSFALFYATGYLPFMLFHDTTNKIGAALRFSRPLLAYPAVSMVDAVLARWLLNTATHVIVGLIVFAGIEAVIDTSALYRPGPILAAYAMAAALALGVGTLNCWLFMRFPVWERIWQIATRPLFIVSGIFFLFEDLPADLRDIAWFNPLLHITSDMRRGVFASYDAAFVSEGFVYGTALVCFVTGLGLLRLAGKDLVYG